MKTRAAVAWEAGKPLTIEEIEIGGPQAGEVLVEVMATGICHTDAYTLDGLDSEGIFPSILGHEGAGTEDGSAEGGVVQGVGQQVSAQAVPLGGGGDGEAAQQDHRDGVRGVAGEPPSPDRFACDGPRGKAVVAGDPPGVEVDADVSPRVAGLVVAAGA